MQIGSAMNSAALGLALNRTAMDEHAHAIAGGGESHDLATEIVGTVVASHGFAANAVVLRNAAETERYLFDALA